MVGLPEVLSDLYLNNGVGPLIRPEHYIPGGRIKLEADTTYYVSKTGNDLNSGLDESNAFATIARAWQQLNLIDGCGFSVTIQIGAGTWSDPIPSEYLGYATAKFIFALGYNVLQPVGIRVLTLQGVSGTIFNGLGVSDGIVISRETSLRIKGIKFVNCVNALLVFGGLLMLEDGVEFGACSGAHILATQKGRISIEAGYTVSGGANVHMNAVSEGQIMSINNKITVSNTPGFTYFAVANSLAHIEAHSGTSFTGAATGQKFLAAFYSLIQTVGAGVNFFPGSVAGAAPSGIYN